MKKYIYVILLALIATSATACEDSEMEKLKSAERAEDFDVFHKELLKLIPVGSDEERVICIFDAIGWKYNYDKAHNMYSMSKKLRTWLFLKRHVRVKVYLDSEGKVKEITMSFNNTSMLG